MLLNPIIIIMKVLTIVLLVSTWSNAQQLKNFNQMLAWKTLEYGFHSDIERQYAVDNQLITPNTGTPIDVAVEYMPQGTLRVFTTIPRFSKGVPYTLATISSKVGENGPIIYPYPSYDIHINNNAECTGITSAFRVAVDECNQMWVIDSGIVEKLQLCPPQLLVFDLKTDQLVNRYQFPPHLYTAATSLLINLVVDTHDPPPRGRCQKAMVYIADVRKPGLLVYDSTLNEAWRVENRLFFPDPAYGTHTVAGGKFDLMDGVFALNLTPRNKLGMQLDFDPRIINRPPKHMPSGGSGSGDRYLYFHALASDTENFVPLRILNNKTIWEQNINAFPDAFEEIGHRGVQATMETLDSRGNMYTNTEDPLTVFVWNIYNSPYTYSSFKIVGNNPEQLQFASSMKVVKNLHGQEEVWMVTCKIQKVFTGTLDPSDINFRILACRTDDLLAGRPCSTLETQVMPHSETLYTNLILQ